MIRGLTKAYRLGQPVLKGIDLVVPGTGLTAIIGPSGTGKSTLIRCINRLVQPTSGEILFRGEDLARLSGPALRRARRRIGMVFQEYNLVERLSVMENLLCGRLGYVPAWRAWLRRFPEADIARAQQRLGQGLASATPEARDAARAAIAVLEGLAKRIDRERPKLDELRQQVADHRAPGDGVHHLGARGPHAGAEAGGEDDGGVGHADPVTRRAAPRPARRAST